MQNSTYKTKAAKKADAILTNIERRFAKPEKKSAFQKSVKDLTKNEILAIHMGCDPDANFVNKARNSDQLDRMDTVRRLEKAMQDSRKYGGNPDTTKRQIAEIYGIDPQSYTYSKCNDANDMRRAALAKLLEGLREQVTRIDCDDLFDHILEIVKHGKR